MSRRIKSTEPAPIVDGRVWVRIGRRPPFAVLLPLDTVWAEKFGTETPTRAELKAYYEEASGERVGILHAE